MENSLKKNMIALNAIKSFLMNDSFSAGHSKAIPSYGFNQKVENIYLDMKSIISQPQNGKNEIFYSFNSPQMQSVKKKFSGISKLVFDSLISE